MTFKAFNFSFQARTAGRGQGEMMTFEDWSLNFTLNNSLIYHHSYETYRVR
jgi:hypothetical protein